MATAQFAGPAQITSDAELRTWASGISTALAAAGMVQTSDTGQINLATATKSGSANTSSGYQIWRFADAAQATQPLFIKLEYGTSSSATAAALWVTIGTGTDGAGTITGSRQARQQANRSTGSATTTETYVAAGDGYLTILVFCSTATTGQAYYVAIERFRDAAGAVDTATGTAGLYFLCDQNLNIVFSCYLYDGTANDVSFMVPTLTPNTITGNSGAFKGTTYAYPIYPVMGISRAPSRAAVCYFSADVSAAQTFTASLYGNTHTFRATGPITSIARSGTGYVGVRAD